MVYGTFMENPTDPHVSLRGKLLKDGSGLPRVGPLPAVRRSVPARELSEDLRSDLARTGVALRRFDRPLTNDQYRELGEALGNPMPETDPAVQPFVEDQVVLNLISSHEETADASLQPFAANYLSLHTESSGRPVPEQPRYLALMCCEPGDDPQAALTVLTPMERIAQRLAEQDIALLRTTRYRHGDPALRLVRAEDDRLVLSFRDFMSQPLEWINEDDVAVPAVNDAIGALLTSMYDPSSAMAVQWEPGLLVVFDNRVFFHGRTARLRPANHRRHLKRLRIVANTAD
ncbi:TauD/TfdA family dioxygenase [Nonomuraea sp. B5E05]|uniref:TauD/TfdA family dioxygenase n=1 Tax=Nonomuraea sp. B5E05 TaxID=3153569 RepID=UPI0032602306